MPEIDGIELAAPPWDDFTLDLVLLQYYDGPRLLLQKCRSE